MFKEGQIVRCINHNDRYILLNKHSIGDIITVIIIGNNDGWFKSEGDAFWMHPNNFVPHVQSHLPEYL